MPIRYETEASVARYLEGFNGWDRNPYQVSGMVRHLAETYPEVPVVDDGPTSAGRGSTGADMFRVRNLGGIVRHDVLSIKTGKIEGDKLPSKVSLSTGCNGAPGLLSALLRGAPLPTLIFAMKDREDDRGAAIMLDMGKVVRDSGGIQFAPEEGYTRGTAPTVYLKWSAARKSGVKGKYHARSEMEFPCVEGEQIIGGENYPVKRWIAPDRCQYAEINVSLYACGIRKHSWHEVKCVDLPRFVESFDFNEAAGY